MHALVRRLLTHKGACMTVVCRCVEALARAGEYDKGMLHKAVAMFEVRAARRVS